MQEQFTSEDLTAEVLTAKIVELSPSPANKFTPDNLDEIIQGFLDGDSESFNNATYSQLDSLDIQSKIAEYKTLLHDTLASTLIPSEYARTYQSFVAYQIKVYEMMGWARTYRLSQDEVEREKAAAEYKRLNIELYGQVIPENAKAMAKEIFDDSSKIDNPEILRIRDEFLSLLPQGLKQDMDSITPNAGPSNEARQTVQRIIQSVYSPLLRHADELIGQLAEEEQKEVKDLKVGPQGIAVIFQTIIDKEFPDSGWKVVLGQANAIKVDTPSKIIKVPETRKSSSTDKVKGLVVHELGIHMLRSIIGEQSDLPPLRFGLESVGTAEEGLAKIMESTISGDDSRIGYQHYLTAYLFENGLDFKQTHDVMWRYKVLDSFLNKPVDKIDDEYLAKRKREAAKFVFRSVRGSGALPWHSMLSYFQGTKMWDFIEENKDDPDKLLMIFMGKIDPTNISHLNSALDAKGKA